MLPHLIVLHVDAIPRDSFYEFEQLVRTDGLKMEVRSRGSNAAFAGLEWLLPTAVIAYIAKAYFESFLKEMGKDHYDLLKEGLKRLYARTAGPEAPQVSLVATAGKALQERPYSLLLSITAEISHDVQFKLLIQTHITQLDYEAAVSSFLEFMQRLHAGTLDSKTLTELHDCPIVGKTMLVTYNPQTKSIVPVNPLVGNNIQ
jgi:hypothetical protein